MAATKTLIFTGVTVDSIVYDKHLMEGAEVTLEPLTTQIDDGQTLIDAYDVSFQVDLYNSAVLDNASINQSGGTNPSKVTVIFTGAAGGQTLTITGVIVNATLTFDNQRTAVRLTGSKRAVSIANSITLTNA